MAWQEIRTVGLATCAALALGASASGLSQSQDKAPLVFRSDVTLVAVPVFVTDKNGVAVGGLAAEDFEITENGRPVPIAAFQAVDVDNVPARAASGTIRGSGSGPLALQAETPRQFVILLDRQYSTTRGLLLGRPAAADFVRRSLAPTDLVSVVDSGPQGFVTLVSFTTDHEYAARAIQESKQAQGGPDPLGISGRGPATGSFSVIGGVSGGQALPSASQTSGNSKVDAELAFIEALETKAAAGAQATGVGQFLSNLLGLIQELAPLRGRKQIVLLSGGIPESAWQALPGEYGDATSVNEGAMRRLHKVAGAADVVINTISLDGIRAAGDVGESSQPQRTGQALNQGAGRASLVAMALDTGGRFIYPTNNFGIALKEVDRISRRFYVLGFEAAEESEVKDRPRRLRVRVKRDGLSVSHRPEYALKREPVGEAPRRQAAEAIAKGLSGGAVKLDLASVPHRDAQGNPTLHAVLQIDPTAFGDIPPGPLVVEIYGYLMGEGKVVDSLAGATSVDIARVGDRLRESGLQVVAGFSKAPALADLRFFVRLGPGGPGGSIQRLIDVPRSRRGDISLSPPMLTTSTEGRVVIPLQPKGQNPLQIPFRVGGAKFLPDAVLSLHAGIPREVCIFVSRPPTVLKSPFEVKGVLVGEDNASFPLGVANLRVIADTDGFDRYLMDVAPPVAVAPGEYRLRLTFTDPSSGRSVSTEASVKVAN